MLINALFIAYALLQAADLFTTGILLKNGGLEGNPALSWVIAEIGIAGLLAAKMLNLLFVSATLEWTEKKKPKMARIGMLFSCGLMMLVVSGNMALLFQV